MKMCNTLTFGAAVTLISLGFASVASAQTTMTQQEFNAQYPSQSYDVSTVSQTTVEEEGEPCGSSEPAPVQTEPVAPVAPVSPVAPVEPGPTYYQLKKFDR